MGSPRRIVVLSDGTGNSAGAVWRTNVWRLYQLLELSNGHQVALYDDGVGTSSFKPLAILGGAFGWGLKRNVLDLYRFVCRNHVPGAEIFAFGFSRGAFTIRVLTGLIANEGLVPLESEDQLRRDAAGAYRQYRKRYNTTGGLVPLLRWLRDVAIGTWQHLRKHRTYAELKRSGKIRDVRIRFLGLWDTVSAYGLPIEEMTRGADFWLWPMSPPDRKLSGKVDRACHALALDDARTTFHPMLWTEAGEAPPRTGTAERRTSDERLSQVWFTGMHSNVGGGYPDDGLANVSLHWIMREAQSADLEFKAPPDAVETVRAASDQDGRLYDSRHGLGGTYRYGPRRLLAIRRGDGPGDIATTFGLIRDRFRRVRPDEVMISQPKIHESVLQRITTGARSYAPINLPETYAVVTTDGRILEPGANPYETPAHAAARVRSQERMWDVVWRRRVVYFASFVAAMYLVVFPWVHPPVSNADLASRLSFLAPAIRAVAAVLPSFAARWTDAFAASPGIFALGAGILAWILARGASFEQRIRDEMRLLWSPQALHGALPDGWIFRLRTHPAYVGFILAMKHYILPTVFALGVMVPALLMVGGRALFAVESSLGLACNAAGTTSNGFETSSFCWPTGASVEAGKRYRVALTIGDPWRDKSIDVPSPEGFPTSRLPLFARPFVLFRRHLGVEWFRPIARIGAAGNDETPLTFMPVPNSTPTQWVAEIDARTSGPLFLYVNDVALPFSWLRAPFYGNNAGTAAVVVTAIDAR